MFRAITVLLAGVILSGCMATDPERMRVIHPEDPNVYAGLSCAAIDAEIGRLEPRLDQTYGNLKFLAETDRLQAGLIPIFPPMALTLEAVDGPDALHFRTMRGQETLLHREWRRKDCPDDPPTTEQLYQAALEAAKKSE